MYGLEFINAMKYNIQNIIPVAGNRELVTRCPFCGDSKKNPTHKHFYISVPQNDDELPMFHCKLCSSAGIVDDSLLRLLDVSNASLLVQIKSSNERIFKLPKYKTLKNINILPLKNDYIRNDKNNQYKIDYINNRIGSNFSQEQLAQLKIVLNLYDLLNSNRLILTRHKSIGDSLDKFFIGFISYDNSFINMRKVTDQELYKSINKRYINYNIIDKLDNRKNYYIIPTNIDIINPMPVNIHIAEGPFDILSIYYNLNKCNNYQNIYIGCGGKGYLNSLKFILQEIGIINFNIHFYIDNDVSDYEFSKSLSVISMLNCDVYIHRNTFNDEKDFGVPLNRIKDSIIKVQSSSVFI